MKHSKGNISSLPILSHMKCNCDATDIDVMFRNCCISVDGCTDSLQSITLFDTGAHMSYVSRQVAAWITDLAIAWNTRFPLHQFPLRVQARLVLYLVV